MRAAVSRADAPGGDGPAEAPAPAEGPPPSPSADAGPEARRLAAAVLEVLGGVQTPSEAARALGLSLDDGGRSVVISRG